MRIFDENDNELFEYDRAKGHLKSDKLFVKHHPQVEAVQEEGHWKTVAEYPNGGKDVEWVIDVPRVEAKDAWDEYEDILRYIPFTERELASHRIIELKSMLNSTDYNILKVVEVAAYDEIENKSYGRAWFLDGNTIITNYHVISSLHHGVRENFDYIDIRFYDSEQYETSHP